MSKYEQVARYYESGIWSQERLKGAVSRGWISAEEYKALTGEEYDVSE